MAILIHCLSSSKPGADDVGATMPNGLVYCSPHAENELLPVVQLKYAPPAAPDPNLNLLYHF